MALVQWGWGMKVIHEWRLGRVSVASNPQKRDRERDPHVLYCRPSLVIDLKGSLRRKRNK